LLSFSLEKMVRLVVSVLVAVLLALSAVAVPISTEIDRTQVTVAEQDSGNVEEFIVQVVRVEDDVDEKGQIKGESALAVALKFEVTEDLKVTVNGQPVPFGFSEIDVTAKVMASNKAEASKITKVEVEIFVGIEKIVDPSGKTIQKIIIQERVTEIEDNKVWQADVREQVIHVHGDGQIVRGSIVQIAEMMKETENKHPENKVEDPEKKKGDKLKDGKKKKPHPHHPQDDKKYPTGIIYNDVGEEQTNEHDSVQTQFSKTMHRAMTTAMSWYHQLPFVLRVIIAFVVGMLAGFIALAIASCLAFMCGSGKKRMSSYDANLRAYAVQYTSLPLDEKAVKKEKESGSVELV